MIKDYYNFIEDEEELKWFFDQVLVKPKVDQSYTICLAARNKKLNEEERKLYNLNKGQMINVDLLKAKGVEQNWNYDIFYSKIAGFECNKRGILCKSNLPFPEKCLVLYICLKLADENDCIKKSIDLYQDIQQEIVNKIRKRNFSNFDEELYKLIGYNQYQLRLHANCLSEKPYMDFDLDINDPPEGYNKEDMCFELYPAFKDYCDKWFKKGNYFIIKTGSGFHTLVKKEVIKFNPNDFINNVMNDEYIKGDNMFKVPFTKEFIKNDNLFIPIPGTLQYGKTLVKVMNKEDFTK